MDNNEKENPAPVVSAKPALEHLQSGSEKRELGVVLERIRELLQELLKVHPQSAVEEMLDHQLAKIQQESERLGQGAAQYEAEYRQATQELSQERQKYLGFGDVVKGLIQWVETPEERVQRNASLKVD
jgi:DNA-binding transcriptional MerR regulator